MSLASLGSAAKCALLGLVAASACAEDAPVPPGIAVLEYYLFSEGAWVLVQQDSFDYDEEGRLINGSMTFIGLNGDVVPGWSFRLRYDGDRLIEELSGSDRDQSPDPDDAVRYQYDDGRLARIDYVALTSTPGVERAVGYVSYDYDEHGRAFQKIEERGEAQQSVIEYFYDDQDRVREEQWSLGGEVWQIVRYTIEDGLLTERVEVSGNESPRRRTLRVYDLDRLVHTTTTSVWDQPAEGEPVWKLEAFVEITRDPANRSLIIERTEPPDYLLRNVVTFAPDGTMNLFDRPGWPRISEWDRSSIYPPRLDR